MAREVWVEMLRVLGFATDWFRSNVRVILQYSVMRSILSTCANDATNVVNFATIELHKYYYMLIVVGFKCKY